MRNHLAKLITKLSDAELAERLEACRPEFCSDAALYAALDAEKFYREQRAARKAG